MAFESFRGPDIWSSEEAPNSNANLYNSGQFAVAAAVAGGGLYAGYKYNNNSMYPMIEGASDKLRRIGNLTPFQLANTFRVPEFLSFFTSAQYKNRVLNLSGNTTPISGVIEWGRDALQNEDTADYISSITGRSRNELAALGFEPTRIKNLVGSDTAKLSWSGTGPGRGRLSFVQNISGVESSALLSEDIAVGAFSHEVNAAAGGHKGEVNKLTEGMMRAAGVGERTDDSVNKILRSYSASGSTAPSFMPVPSMLGKLDNFDDLARRSTILRGIYSFSANRFNELMETFVDTMGGDKTKEFMRNVLGVNPKVKGGTASSLMARYAGRAAAFGGAVLAVDQLDWFRRQHSFGQVFSSGVMSAGFAYAAHKMGHTRVAKYGAAATFLGQLVLPGFDEGLVPGVASSLASLDVIRGSPLNPMTHYRRTVEGLLPGFTGFEFTALTGAAALLATSIRSPISGQTLAEKIFSKYGNIVGVSHANIDNYYGVNKEALSPRDIYWNKVSEAVDKKVGAPIGMERRTLKERALLFSQFEKLFGADADFTANSLFQAAETEHKELMRNSFTTSGGINNRMVEALRGVASKYQGQGLGKKVMMNVEGFGVQLLYSVFGADASYNKDIRSAIKGLGFKGPVGSFGKLLTVAGAGMAAHSILSGNLLGSLAGSEELSRIYSGEQLVEVKSSRAWEAGGTPFEGGETSYFRPHQLALMKSRAREKAVWGENEDEISPLKKFFIKNFTYDLERMNYYRRPYQMTGSAFQDVPIVGDILAGSVGQLIKRARPMHLGEWVREGESGLEYASLFTGAKSEPAYALGAPKPGVPVSPFAAGEIAKQMVYQFREIEGMTGWAKNIIQQTLTGSAQWENPAQSIATSNEMDSTKRNFWEMNLGGALFSNEIMRRLLPPDRQGLVKQNAIRNDMPYWLPDKFHYGDPFTQIEWGDARLPGAGYAALHPELKGIDPNDYPLIARYAILGDVAPTSYEFNKTQREVYKKRYEGGYNKQQEVLIDTVAANAASVISKLDFRRTDPNAYNTALTPITGGLFHSLLSVAREVAAPAEYLFPMGFRPMQKLTGQLRTPIEEYEHRRMYGTNMAFWDKPIRDWFRPAAYSAAHLAGFDGKPGWRMEADAASQRFDQIEFVKWMRLAQVAKQNGLKNEENQYLWAAQQTRTGVNPQGSPLAIYWALPAEDRAFMDAFARAAPTERGRILEMVPKDQQHLYKALWSRLDSGDPTAQYPTSAKVDGLALAQKAAVLEQQIDMPKEDWIGWNQEVDISDIKVRYAQNHALDLQDYGMWDKQLKKSYNQPFLDGAELEVPVPSSIMAQEIRNSLSSMAGPLNSNYTVNTTYGMSRARIAVNDDRESAIQRLRREANYGL